jgi:hypothetical protein
MDLNERNFREGQLIVYKAMIDRITRGILSTGIVLHPRGGKSDLQRMICLWAVSRGYCCAGISININVLLRDQMGDNDRYDVASGQKTRMEEALRRYEVKKLNGIDPVRVVGYRAWPEPPLARGEVFASFTIQTLTAKSGYDGLMQWVESMVASGKPPIFFFDECQMLGGPKPSAKPWAALFYALLDRGAFVVSMTGTPHREDGEPIPGFTMEIRNIEDVERVSVEDDPEDPSYRRIVTKQGQKTEFVLRGDIEVGLRYGWNPPPGQTQALCHLTRDTFDFEVNIEGDGCPAYSGLISEAPTSVLRRALGRAVRDPEIISAAVDKLLFHLSQMRVRHSTVKAIVFTGNDSAEGESNAHARQVEKEIKRRDPEIKCLIATSSKAVCGDDGSEDEEIAKKIASFDKSKYDVLIVKLAGGVGLDAPSIKVGLDLSTVRSFGLGIQRFLRVATPFGDLLQGVWICPQDSMWDRIWEDAVKSNNGEMSVTNLELVNVVREKKREVDPPTHNPLIIDLGSAFQGNIYDNAGRVLEPSDEDWEAVARLLNARPYLRNRLTVPELFDLSKAVDVGMGVGVDANDLIPDPGATIPIDTVPSVEHSETGLDTLRERINATAARIIKFELTRMGYSKEQMNAKGYGGRTPYGEYSSRLWWEAKTGIVPDPSIKLSKIIDIDKLNAINERLNRRERGINDGNETRASA